VKAVKRTSDGREHRQTPSNTTYKVAGAALVLSVLLIVGLCLALFRGQFHTAFALQVDSDRIGLVMDQGAKVRMRGVVIGTVAATRQVDGRSNLVLHIEPDQVRRIPANATAQIKSTTVFGAKYVQIDIPSDPAPRSVTPNQVIRSANVTTEVNTLFERLNSIMGMIEPAKLNALLRGLADGLRGHSNDLASIIVDGDAVLTQLNPAMPTLGADFEKTAEVSTLWAGAAPDLLSALDHLGTTAVTVTDNELKVNRLLLALTGMGDTGGRVLAANATGVIDSMNTLVPTTGLLEKYSPEYACLFKAAEYAHDSMSKYMGGNGYSLDFDVALLAGDDPYAYPRNLPKVAAAGGPGGQPGCYPDITREMYPAPVLVMDNGAPEAVAGSTRPRTASPTFISYLFGNTVGAGR
jgi:phospholipid/cholesterol/gamma-HCH transport system substrate-binding protein